MPSMMVFEFMRGLNTRLRALPEGHKQQLRSSNRLPHSLSGNGYQPPPLIKLEKNASTQAFCHLLIHFNEKAQIGLGALHFP
jgi:hypothetical protein